MDQQQETALEVTKPAKPPRKSRIYDWPAIRAAYVEGIETGAGNAGREFLSLEKVAEHFGVVPARVRAMSARERWPARRNAYQMEVASKRKAARLSALAEQSVDFDDKSLNVARMGMAMVTARLAEIAEELKVSRVKRENARSKMERGEKVERHELWSAINYKELEGLSHAAATFQDIGRKALGTDIDRVEVTGADGGAIAIDGKFSIQEELQRDDPERLAQILMAAQRAGITKAILDSEVVEGEIVDEEPRGIGA